MGTDVGNQNVVTRVGVTSLQIVLGRLGWELEALHVLSETVQAATARLIQCAPPDAEAVGHLQSLDSLTQHLCALSSFVDALAVAVPADGWIDLGPMTSNISLGLLRSRLLEGNDQSQADDDGIEIF